MGLDKEKYLKHLESRYNNSLNGLTLAKSKEVIDRNRAIIQFINSEKILIASGKFDEIS